VLLASLDWLDLVQNCLNLADCAIYGAKDTVFSQWPGTEIVIPVTALAQCPDEDIGISVQIARQVAPYAVRHAWQFWVIRSLLFAGNG
jgi:hypothetical protein